MKRRFMEKRFPDELNKLDDAKNWGCKDQRKLDMKILRGTQKRIRMGTLMSTRDWSLIVHLKLDT